MNRDEVLAKLTALDFMALDLALFLDTNPNNKEVIELYNEVLNEAAMVRSIYEKNFGPLCSFRSLSDANNFKWIDNPWPFQECFNYDIN